MKHTRSDRLRLAPPAALLTLLACGGGAGPDSPVPAVDACTLARAEVAAVDTLVVVLESTPRRVGVSAPATEPGTSLPAFYETLVRLDCRGNLVPGLAVRWERIGGGTRFTLRDTAQFTDGAPVNALSVAASLAGRAGVAAISVEGERTVVIGHSGDDPALLASPALAITREVPGGERRVGTGDYAVESIVPARDGGLRRALGRARVAGVPPFLRIEVPASADRRDAIDAGAGVVITRDPESLAYARRLDAYEVTPLPWDRRYVLATPGGGAVDPLPGGLRESLAREVVRADARPAPGTGDTCSAHESRTSRDRSGQPAIAYPRSDPAAAALAERLAVLAGTPGNAWLATRLGVVARERVRAEGLAEGAFAAAVRAGTHAGIVVSVPIRPGALDSDACLPDSTSQLVPGLLRIGAVTPLVDTRPHLVRRRGTGPLRIDGFGGVRPVASTGAPR